MQRREALTAEVRAAAIRRITERMLALPAFRDAHCVLANASMVCEFDISALLIEVPSQKPRAAARGTFVTHLATVQGERPRR